MWLDGNRQSFSHLIVALGCSTAIPVLFLAGSAQGKGPDRLGLRDDWDAMPCQMQSISNPEGEGVS